MTRRSRALDVTSSDRNTERVNAIVAKHEAAAIAHIRKCRICRKAPQDLCTTGIRLLERTGRIVLVLPEAP